jgi:hypothetical protein
MRARRLPRAGQECVEDQPITARPILDAQRSQDGADFFLGSKDVRPISGPGPKRVDGCGHAGTLC